MQKAIKRFFPIFVLPTFIIFIIAFIIPFISGIFLSFTEFTTVTNAKWVGLSNYIKAFASKDELLYSLWFTIKFMLFSVISVNVVAFIFSLFLTRGLKGTNIFRTAFFMPNLIGGIILGYIWQLIFNGILRNIPATLTTDPKYGFWGLVILTNWQMIGYMMVIYIAAIQNIPRETLDAAEVDGASPLKMLLKIKIPFVMPAIGICTFLTMTNSFKLFDQNLALTNGAPSKQTEMLALNIFNTFYGRNGYEGVGQAKAVIFSLLVGFVALLQLKLTSSKEKDI
ncbi:MAG: sugar ABC transporter permease [Clostridiales bacterium]|nr:sugar ABC transporter permease [Clostridiales bacterium]